MHLQTRKGAALALAGLPAALILAAVLTEPTKTAPLPSPSAPRAEQTALTGKMTPPADSKPLPVDLKWRQQQQMQLADRDNVTANRPRKPAPRPEERAVEVLNDPARYKAEEAAAEADRQAMLARALKIARASGYHEQPDQPPAYTQNSNPEPKQP